MFDCALFYSNDIKYKNSVLNIIESNEIKDLVNHISKFKDRPDIKELLIFI